MVLSAIALPKAAGGGGGGYGNLIHNAYKQTDLHIWMIQKKFKNIKLNAFSSWLSAGCALRIFNFFWIYSERLDERHRIRLNKD